MLEWLAFRTFCIDFNLSIEEPYNLGCSALGTVQTDGMSVRKVWMDVMSDSYLLTSGTYCDEECFSSIESDVRIFRIAYKCKDIASLDTSEDDRSQAGEKLLGGYGPV